MEGRKRSGYVRLGVLLRLVALVRTLPQRVVTPIRPCKTALANKGGGAEVRVHAVYSSNSLTKITQSSS